MKRNIFYFTAVILAGVLLTGVVRSCKEVEAPATGELRKLAPGEKRSWAVEKAMFVGAKGKVTLRVVDTKGEPVPNAIIEGNFFCSSKSNDGFRTRTDGVGVVTLSGTVSDELNIAVSKEGYYQSTLAYWFYKDGYECLQNGRWLPWNPTLEVVLKEKRKPAEMICKWVSVSFPKNAEVGFDFAVGDLVAPDGKGGRSDVLFRFASWQVMEPYCCSNKFSISSHSGGGQIRLRKDKFSRNSIAYEAPKEGWQQETVLGQVMTKSKLVHDARLSESDYFIVMCANGDGTRNYAVIDKLEFGGSDRGTNFAGIVMSYYYNPTPNDTNLEHFDGRGYGK